MTEVWVPLAIFGAIWVILGLIILIALVRAGGTERYHLGHYLVTVVAGPPVLAMLIAQGLFSRPTPPL